MDDHWIIIMIGIIFWILENEWYIKNLNMLSTFCISDARLLIILYVWFLKFI